jgi:ferredoxin
MLTDLYQIIHPSLTVLDGIVGMEGNGPGSGDPIRLGLILASRDALSLDQVVCDLIRIPRKSLMTNQVALEEGMGRDGIEIVGERLEEIRIPHFRLPAPASPNWDLPGFLQKALKNALTSRPVAEEKVCKACNRCVEICPPRTLERRETSLFFDYGKCIRCFCCQEICPEGAISIKPGWALKLVGGRQSVKSQ